MLIDGLLFYIQTGIKKKLIDPEEKVFIEHGDPIYLSNATVDVDTIEYFEFDGKNLKTIDHLSKKEQSRCIKCKGLILSQR